MNELVQTKVNSSIRGTVFDIKRFATKDGPGIRTLIFLKGCPLRCKWCANPESQSAKPEIIYFRSKCAGCGKCVENCPQKAIKPDEKYGLIIDKEKCTACGTCERVCYYGARELAGKEMAVSEVMEIIMKDKKYYDNSGGGVTVTGGEPLLQAEFTRELLKECKSRGIHTTIETCGFTRWQDFNDVLPYLDLVFFDFKHIGPELHHKYTGVNNETILDNMRRLNDAFTNVDIIVRIPFIPGHNSSDEVQKQMYTFVSRLKRVKRIEIMPYHRFGITKYHGLGRKYDLVGIEPVKKKDLDYLKELGNNCGVQVIIDPE